MALQKSSRSIISFILLPILCLCSVVADATGLRVCSGMENYTATKTTSTENIIISRAEYEELLAKLSEAKASLKEAQSSNDGLKSRVE